ncbi:MAG: hypothetical protein R2856_23340 [Caldilineaceae bacterium]
MTACCMQDGHLRPFFHNAGDVARSFLDRVGGCGIYRAWIWW